jgi:transcriptional regulator with XRE-family HTH domain
MATRNVDQITQQACRRIRELRAARGWSLERLAERSGVSRSMLSEIERGRANPTLAVTLKIARAFEISLDDLVETSITPPLIEVVRGDDPSSLYRQDSDCEIRTLSPLQLEKDVEFYEIKLAREGVLRSAPHFEGTREFLTVNRGRVQVESDAATVALKSGDSATYRADVPHAIVNVGRSGAILFLIVIYPSS